MFFYKQNEVKAASYSRLSREDGDKMESDSIRNQKDLIADYAAQRGIRIVSEYTDATVIIGLKQNPTHGRRFSPIFLLYWAFCEAKRKMLL